MSAADASVRTFNWYRWGAISNWAVTLPAIVSPALGAWLLGIDNLGAPFLLRIWAGIAFVWGWMFWRIATDPVRGRWMMKYAIIEKAITATAVTAAYSTDGSGVEWRCFVFVLFTDHFWIVPFWLVRSRTPQDPSDTTWSPGWAEAAGRFGARWLWLAGLLSLAFAFWLFAGDVPQAWLGRRPLTPSFLTHIWAGMTALLGLAVLEVAAGDSCRRRAMLGYGAAARSLVAASVAIAVARHEVGWPLAVVVLLADTVWLVPLLVINAYWRGGPSAEAAYRDARRVLAERAASVSSKKLLTRG